MAASTYTAKDITALEGLEPVRKRPGMYIGGVGPAGLHHLVWEIVDNAVDEAMNGHADEIRVTLHKDCASITVEDNGRGIPVDMHPKHKVPALQLILCTLHAGGKFEGQNYKTSGGLHGVGASVVNALSKLLVATVKRDGARWEMTFKRGKPEGKIKKLGPARGSGTTIFFAPDATIFPKVDFNPDTIRERLEVISYIHKRLRIIFEDLTTGSTHTFENRKGLKDYLDAIRIERSLKPVHDAPFRIEKDNGIHVDLILQWTESTDEHIRSYVNGIPTGSGGSHEAGLRAGLGKAVRNYIDTHSLQPRGVTLTSDDIREGLTGVISIFVTDPQFQGQTKDKLNNPEVQPAVDAIVRQDLEHWLNHNRSVAESIVARIILAARAREASRAASAQITRKTATTGRIALPGKLSDCTHPESRNSELFIVEGDSAGGSAKQGRDRTSQAILPLRGKVLNTESVSLKKVLENKEIADVLTALGCGMGKTFDLSKLRYERVILLMDADSDGHHISILLLTFFYRHLQELIKAGRVYLAQPPLYRVDIGKESFWALDDRQRDGFIEKHRKGNAKVEITRFKGLGEMMPKTLWETTLHPKTLLLLRVEIANALDTDRIVGELMGKDPSSRFRFIMENAEAAQELDV